MKSYVYSLLSDLLEFVIKGDFYIAKVLPQIYTLLISFQNRINALSYCLPLYNLISRIPALNINSFINL
jgi:hypothetical protein